jgi:hypothetical protein
VLVLLIANSILGSTIYAEETKAQKKEMSTTVGEASCSNLSGKSISKSSIGLRTTGASITSAILTADDKSLDFCKVLGSIHPVDSSAPDIQFEVNLPSNWNGKSLQVGGGGFNGSVVTGLDSNFYDPINTPTPLARGYVTFGSDSGHVSAGWDASWATNDEALANFAGEQLKKTHDVAMTIIEDYYKMKPSQTYFSGGSEGGREALVVIQRWPQDYDGAVIFFPTYNWIAKAVQDNRNMQALYKNNGEGWISPEENKHINRIVLQACDSLDGAADGIISNTEACKNKEDQILDALSNAGLSDAQIDVIQTYNSPMKFRFSFNNKVDSTAGYSQLQGADIGGQFGSTFTPKAFSDYGSMSQFSDRVLRYMVTKNPNLDTFTFNPDEWKKEIQTASKLLEPSDPNLSAFKALGGKLILVHGTSDEVVTPYGTIKYYHQLENKFGDKLSEFAQFYMVPGYGHGSGDFNMSADLLGELDGWVATGSEPTDLLTTDKANNYRTRPLCEFPAWPQYNGIGDVNLAASYTCSR